MKTVAATSELSKSFAANLRCALDELHITQRELAERMDTGLGQIARLLACRNSPTLETVQRCADALKIQPDELLLANPPRRWRDPFTAYCELYKHDF